MKPVFRTIITYSVLGKQYTMKVPGQKSEFVAAELIKSHSTNAVLIGIYHDEL